MTVAAALALALAALSCARRPPATCRTFPDLQPIACSLAPGGALLLPPQSLSRLSFEAGAPAAVLLNDRDFYFVARSGKTAPAFPFDNGPDYFVEGLARTLRGGKVGFVNPQLDEVIAPVWDFASPFDHGRARVCTACVPTRARAGVWQEIDPSGRVISSDRK